MKKFKTLMLVAAGTMGLSMAAQAALPVSTFAGVANNNIVDEDVVLLQVSTEVSNLEVGLSAEFNDEDVYTYGAFVGVPLRIQNTNFVLTPRVTVDDFREQNETLYGAGAKLSYMASDTLSVDGLYTYRGSFDDDVDLDGSTYALGLTKTF